MAWPEMVLYSQSNNYLPSIVQIFWVPLLIKELLLLHYKLRSHVLLVSKQETNTHSRTLVPLVGFYSASMAQPTDLRAIGSEGFGLIDKFYGPSLASARRRPNGNGVSPARQGRWVVQVPNDELEEPVINSREALARYGGIMIVSYPKPQTRSFCLKASSLQSSSAPKFIDDR
ncbi:hypothetical protein Fmac_008915 [Flemingia macrophylla]|uniref:Uncharacterized protein n=1 Tax=Flemingia macrophylla TaxID=520843 RepID=A0ABD1MYR2_9FABA